jgi:hypothetical protein
MSSVLRAQEREGTMRGSVTDWGSADGMPAKIVYTPGSRRKDIYWGGPGRARRTWTQPCCGSGHQPHAVRYIRINGQVVATHHMKRDTSDSFASKVATLASSSRRCAERSGCTSTRRSPQTQRAGSEANSPEERKVRSVRPASRYKQWASG